MAATRRANVIVFDDVGGTVTGNVLVRRVLYVGGSGSPSATISASGGVVWEATGASRIEDGPTIWDSGGITVALAGTGTKLYVYLAV